MAEKKAYAKTRQMVDFNAVVSAIGDNGLYCIDKGVYQIIRQILKDRAFWRTTYYKSLHNDGYIIPTVEDFNAVDNALSEFFLGGDMSCDIVQALNQIEDAIRDMAAKNSTCGSGAGSGGSGVTGGAASDFVSDGANFPDGFPDKPYFDAYKCNMAEFILRNIEVDIQAMVNIQASEVSVAGLIATLVTPIPLDDIAMAAVTIATIIGEAYFDAVLTEIEEAIEDNRSELRCLLYNAISTEDAHNSIIGWIADNLGDMASGLLNLFFGFDNLNRLFQKTNIPVSLGADCSMCGAELIYIQPQYSNSDVLDWDLTSSVFSWTADGSTGGISGVSIHADSPVIVSGFYLANYNSGLSWRVEYNDSTNQMGTGYSELVTATEVKPVTGIVVQMNAAAFSGHFGYSLP